MPNNSLEPIKTKYSLVYCSVIPGPFAHNLPSSRGANVNLTALHILLLMLLLGTSKWQSFYPTTVGNKHRVEITFIHLQSEHTTLAIVYFFKYLLLMKENEDTAIVQIENFRWGPMS